MLREKNANFTICIHTTCKVSSVECEEFRTCCFFLDIVVHTQQYGLLAFVVVVSSLLHSFIHILLLHMMRYSTIYYLIYNSMRDLSVCVCIMLLLAYHAVNKNFLFARALTYTVDCAIRLMRKYILIYKSTKVTWFLGGLGKIEN